MPGIRTSASPTWCPGCFNFHILAGVQKVIEEQIKKGKSAKEFAIVAGIGCHAKLFDYLALSGLNSLHGRAAATSVGLKLARPKLNVIAFSGDGDAYSEGLDHLIQSARYNSNFKYIIHNNQVFALTLGQPTPVTESSFKDRTNPVGVKLIPLNPIKIMLSSQATFVARVFADESQVQEVLKEALAHKGFAFIEVIQPCIIFHNDSGYKERMYNLQSSGHDKKDLKTALEKADEFDYNSPTSKIPLGIFYQKEKITFEELKLKPLTHKSPSGKVNKYRILKDIWQK